MVTPQRPQTSPVPNPAGNGGIPGLGNATPDFLGELKTEVAASEAAPLLSWIAKHIKAIIAFFIILVLLIIGYGIWQWQSERNQREAQLQFGRILISDDLATRISGLEAFLPQAPKDLKNGVYLEIAVSAVAVNDLKKAADAYKQVRLDTPDSAAGLMAAMNEASLLLQLNKADEAVTILDTLEKNVPDFLKVSLQERKAFALEQAGRYAEALPIYEAMLNSRTDTGTDFIRFKISELKSKNSK